MVATITCILCQVYSDHRLLSVFMLVFPIDVLCLCTLFHPNRYRTTKDITLPFRCIPLVREPSSTQMEIKVHFQYSEYQPFFMFVLGLKTDLFSKATSLLSPSGTVVITSYYCSFLSAVSSKGSLIISTSWLQGVMEFRFEHQNRSLWSGRCLLVYKRLCWLKICWL